MPGVLMIEGMAQTAGVLCLRQMSVARTPRADVFPHHRQGQVPQAGGAGRHHRISRQQDHAPPQHVVVPSRGQGRRCSHRRGRSRRRSSPRLEMAIDPTARVAAGARIDESRRDRTLLHRRPAGRAWKAACACSPMSISPASTTLGEGTVVYPFSSLGTPPQSVHYRGGATRLVIGPRCELREGVTMNTGTEAGGGITRVGERCFVHGRLPCRTRLPGRQRCDASPTTSCSAVTSASAITPFSAAMSRFINSCASGRAS